ncbi:uncharacterized protein LOC127846926 [Dreissena polymorpha]|uniref:B box-type domain-containing protein n=1 Tax=Dreissena polymorpha TaxID=45954 RepID=A0A9D4DPT6_DREPO|nr:uncharacterized protein LOC127846926 [Dreissena polymorpha]KAH3752445.1 hypothetical protein DPMN_187062 [Dreissena polymorpha]
MATFSQSTIEKGSETVQDFLCSTCEDENLFESNDYYCESCVKFYCQKCIHMHSQLFKKNSPHGRGDMNKWPVAKKVEDLLLKCDVHKEENLKMYCEDHSQLCCTNCAFLNHRQCKNVKLLSDLVKKNSTDLKKLLVTIQTILGEIKILQDKQNASMRSVQSSYDEQLTKIQETRRKINATLDMLEKKTLKEMKDELTKLKASLRGDVDKFASLRDELKQLGDAIQDIIDKSKLELSFVASIKCQEKIKQSETYKKKNFDQIRSSIVFQPNSDIEQYLSKLSGLGTIEHSVQTLTAQGNPDQVIRLKGIEHSVQTLTAQGNPDQVIRLKGIEHSVQTLTAQGNPDQVIRLNGKSDKYDVSIPSDSYKCFISAVCVLPNRLVLVLDNINSKVKLLGEQYRVVNHCDVSSWPQDICQIAPNKFVATVEDRENTHELLFITVINNRIVKGRKLKLQHSCGGIAHHQGDLFVTSRTALYKYTMSGNLVCKLYEDQSDVATVHRCAVSLTGDKLYITNRSNHKLLTLAMDGSVLAAFTDPELKYPNIVNVTPTGQVLVCGQSSNNILQIDSKGSRKLVTLATQRDGLHNPYSVCYNSNTDSIIVGQPDNNKILVYKVK